MSSDSEVLATSGRTERVGMPHWLKIVLYGGGFALLWAIVDFIAPFGGVSMYEVVWARYGVHLAFMLLVFGPRYRTRLVATPRLGRQIVRSLLMLGMPLCFSWSVQRMSLDTTMALFWTLPFMLLVFAPVRPMKWQLPVAAILGIVGAFAVLRPHIPHHLGVIFPLGMAACLAFYVILSRGMRDEPVMPKLFHSALWVFVSLTFFVPKFWVWPTWHGAIALIGVGILGWLTLLLLDHAMDQTPPALLGPIFFSNVLWEELLQWGVYHKPLSGTAIFGSVLVVIAIWFGLLAQPDRLAAAPPITA